MFLCVPTSLCPLTSPLAWSMGLCRWSMGPCLWCITTAPPIATMCGRHRTAPGRSRIAIATGTVNMTGAAATAMDREIDNGDNAAAAYIALNKWA